MTADLSREEIAFAREFGPQSPVMKRVIDAAEAHRDEPTRLAAARAEGYEEGAQDVHAAHIRHHDRIREIMGIPINAGNHDWRHNPAHLIDTTDLRDAYDTLVVLIGEKINPHAEAARAEGYREGVEAAIADAVAVSIRDEVDSYEMRDDGGGGYSPTDDERIMLEDFGAGLVAVFEQRLRALTPPPAEPAGGTAEPADWTVSDTELARDILCYLGIGSDASLEPGDRRRDRIAAMICADRERRIVKPATRITALEAENAALREVAAAVAKASEGIILGHGEADHEVWTLFLKIGDLRRARALVRGQGGADHG